MGLLVEGGFQISSLRRGTNLKQGAYLKLGANLSIYGNWRQLNKYNHISFYAVSFLFIACYAAGCKGNVFPNLPPAQFGTTVQ